MKLRFGMLLAGLAAVVASFAISGSSGVAYAQERDAVSDEALLFFGEDVDAPRWLRHSIVVCAAQTMHLEVSQVMSGLRHNHSLKEIGIRAGVRPVQLEHGILRCEQHLLARMVHAGELEPGEARRIFRFLADHMTRIICFKWHPDRVAPTDALTSDVALTDVG